MGTNMQSPAEIFMRQMQAQESAAMDPNSPAAQFMAQYEAQQNRSVLGSISNLIASVSQDPTGAVISVGNAMQDAIGGLGGMIGDIAAGAQFLSPGTGPFMAAQAVQGDPYARKQAGRSVEVAAGALETGLANPMEAVLGLPGALIGQEDLPTDKTADWINRVTLGITNEAEQAALDLGLTPEEVSRAYQVGNFVGYTAPIVGSLKIAGTLLRSEQTLAGLAGAGGFDTDFIAGMVYGGLFEEGDAKERVYNMLRESAYFGAMRAALMFGPVLKANRHNRARELDVTGKLLRRIEDMENGRAVTYELTEDLVGDKGVLQIMQEEAFISHSPAALDLLERREYHLALAQGILDIQGIRGSGGVIRGLGENWPTVQELITKFRNQFPGLKIEAVRGPDNAFSIFFGTKGLNNAQRQAFKQTNMFKGMVLDYGGAQVEYAGKATRDGWIKVRTADGAVKEVMEKNTSTLPFIREDLGTEFDAIYQEFKEWFRARHDQIGSTRGGFSEYELIQGVRSGAIKPTASAMRDWDSPALIYPQELGLTGEDMIQGISLTPRTVQQGVPAGNAMIHRNAQRGTEDAIFSMGATPMEGPWRISYFSPAGEASGHLAFDSLDEALEYARQEFDIEDVVTKFPTDSELMQLINRTGMDYAGVLEPPPATSLEEIFDMWAKERGIGKEMSDYWSMRTYFGDRLRRSLWDEVPEADRAIFDRLRNQYEELMKNYEGNISLSQLAAVKGFHLRTLEGGQVSLRNIDTGLAFTFGSERAARDVLVKISKPEAELADLIASGGHSMPDWSRGLPRSEMIFPDELAFDVTKIRDLGIQYHRNMRDYFIHMEEVTTLPVFSKGFDQIHKGYTQMLDAYQPYANAIQDAWKGIDLEGRRQVAEFWVAAEGSELTVVEAARIMQQQGFNAKQIRAFKRSRAIFDELFELTDIDPNRYINLYYTRVRGAADDVTTDWVKVFGEDITPNEKAFWAEFTRTGNLPQIEMDPAMVMHKYTKALFWREYVNTPWEQLAKIVGTGQTPAMTIGDLKRAGVDVSRMNLLPRTKDSSPVIPNEIRSMIKEYLAVIRGDTSAMTQTARSFSERLFRSLGVDVDPRYMEQMVNNWMSTMYGAAMGARLSTIARNMTQTLWLLYPRVGSKWFGKGLEISMTEAGMREVLDEGVIHLKEAGVPYGDVIRENIASKVPRPFNPNNPFSWGLAKLMRGAQVTTDKLSSLSQTSLRGFSSSDDASRAWSYWAQKLHTDDWLKKYEAGKISWERFEDEALGFFPRTLRDMFADTYNHAGREAALRQAARWGSDETNFLYGLAASPLWLQRVSGRLVGQFGTWPIWALEAYMRPIRYASWRQRAKFYGRTAAITAAFINMGLQTGVDMWAWIAPISPLNYGGGPTVQHIYNATRVIGAPLDQKQGAAKRMFFDLARLSFPGQVFYHDLQRAEGLVSSDPEMAAFSLFLGRPSDNYNVAFEQLYNPDNKFAAPVMSPENWADKARSEEYPSWLNTISFMEGPPPDSQTEQPEQMSLEESTLERKMIVEMLLGGGE